MIIFATQSSEYLAQAVSKHLAATLGTIQRQRFSNGERYYRIITPTVDALLGKDAIIVASITNDDDLLEVQRLACTLADLGTRKRLFIIPYLAYATMEIAKLPGEIVTAKTNARLLSYLPKAVTNTFIFLDLHEPSLRHYFEGDVTVIETSAIELLAEAIKQEKIQNPIVGSADLGMPLQTQQLAALLRADIALVSKSREFAHTAVLAAVGDVKNRNVVIYDDMIRSGSSLIQAARAYKKAGAKNIWAALSHFAISSDRTLKQLRKAPLERIITTNSHPSSQLATIRRTKFISVLDISSPVAKLLKKIIL